MFARRRHSQSPNAMRTCRCFRLVLGCRAHQCSCRLDTSHHSSLLATLNLLLKNHSPLSVGAVARAFSLLCPHKLEILHPDYRKLCRVLVDADEWGQVELLDLLGRYARSMLSRPVEGLKELTEGESQVSDQINCIILVGTLIGFGQPKDNMDKFLEDEKSLASSDAVDPDLLLLLKSTQNLFHSRNPAVRPPVNSFPRLQSHSTML